MAKKPKRRGGPGGLNDKYGEEMSDRTNETAPFRSKIMPGMTKTKERGPKRKSTADPRRSPY